MAQGIRSLREALTDSFVQTALMPLQGTTLGFLTDKDKDGGYGLAVVRDCCIEAMLRGFNVVGNEFNIIAGRFYGAKSGFERKVAEFPGLASLVMQPGVPHIAGDKGALVPYSATWILNGKRMNIDCQLTKEGDLTLDQRIPVKVNAGMGADAIIGKATRKLLHRIYQRLNGSTLGLSDGEVGEEPILTTGEAAPSPVPPGTPEGQRIKLGGSKAKTNGAAQAKEHTETPTPASAVSSPAAAPADYTAGTIPISQPAQATPVDLVELHETLEEATKEFNFRGASKLLATWTEAQRAEALEWALAVVNDGPMSVQAKRPIHTLVGRQPGDD
jgi:hypothetical protein